MWQFFFRLVDLAGKVDHVFSAVFSLPSNLRHWHMFQFDGGMKIGIPNCCILHDPRRKELHVVKVESAPETIASAPIEL